MKRKIIKVSKGENLVEVIESIKPDILRNSWIFVSSDLIDESRVIRRKVKKDYYSYCLNENGNKLYFEDETEDEYRLLWNIKINDGNFIYNLIWPDEDTTDIYIECSPSKKEVVK